MAALRLGFAVLAVSVCFASAAAAGGGPSGDPAAIAFYRQVESAYGSVHALVATRRGFFSYTAAGSAFSFRYGQKPPPGFRVASERLLYVFRNGRTTKFVDTARAGGMPPLTVIQDASGLWGKVSNCYAHSPGASNFGGVGQRFVGVFGDFSPLQHSGSTVIVHSTYPWGKTGARATEVDRISAATNLILSLSGHVNGPASFGWSLSGFRQQGAPTKLPTPTPHC